MVFLSQFGVVYKAMRKPYCRQNYGHETLESESLRSQMSEILEASQIDLDLVCLENVWSLHVVCENDAVKYCAGHVVGRRNIGAPEGLRM